MRFRRDPACGTLAPDPTNFSTLDVIGVADGGYKKPHELQSQSVTLYRTPPPYQTERPLGSCNRGCKHGASRRHALASSLGSVTLLQDMEENLVNPTTALVLGVPCQGAVTPQVSENQSAIAPPNRTCQPVQVVPGFSLSPAMDPFPQKFAVWAVYGNERPVTGNITLLLQLVVSTQSRHCLEH